MPPDKAPSDEAVRAAMEGFYGPGSNRFFEGMTKTQAQMRDALEAALPFLLADEREALDRLFEEIEASLDSPAMFDKGARLVIRRVREARSSLGSPEEADRG